MKKRKSTYKNPIKAKCNGCGEKARAYWLGKAYCICCFETNKRKTNSSYRFNPNGRIRKAKINSLYWLDNKYKP